MSVVAATDTPSARVLSQIDLEIDDLKREITTLKDMVGSLAKEMEGVESKLGTVSCASSSLHLSSPLLAFGPA